MTENFFAISGVVAGNHGISFFSESMLMNWQHSGINLFSDRRYYQAGKSFDAVECLTAMGSHVPDK